MLKLYAIRLDSRDLGHLVDGLEIRAESWQRTADYLRSQQTPSGEFFTIEECSRPDEADAIAKHYRSIVRKIRRQMKAQQ